MNSLQPFWHVIYVMPKSEKRVSTQLKEMAYDYYLPLIKKYKEYKNQRRRIESPLFPGYIFIKIGPGFRHHITEIPHVIRFIKFDNEFAKVREEEIACIKTLLTRVPGLHDFIHEPSSILNKDAIFKEGLFKGVKGKITKIQGKDKIIVCVDSINQTFSVLVNTEVIDLLSSSQNIV